jgi:uncharacterized protein (DUF305 family)
MSNKNIIIAMLLVAMIAIIATFFVLIHRDRGIDPGVEHVVVIKTEREFLEHMIPHFEEAVGISNELLSGEVRLRPVRELAKDIVSIQSEETEMMKGRYKNWYQTDYQNGGDYKPMMRSLSGLASPQREKMYLEDMIKHHELAIELAKQVLRLGINDETKELAERILIKHVEEVRVMKELLVLQPNE